MGCAEVGQQGGASFLAVLRAQQRWRFAMRSRVTRSTAIALTSIGVTLAAFSAAHADVLLPVRTSNLTC